MCGIAGIIRSEKLTADREKLQSMVSTLAHRGPDGEQCWQNESGTVSLGHRHLAIIDLSESAMQPMHYLGRYSIIHNGEIYNYIEIREDLKKSGYQFRSNSDTEVILAAYDKWKDDCVNFFDGMFAFAIWDEKEQQLFAARDRFGEKPFYYYYENNALFFASEMKALWAAGVPRIENRQMLFNFLTIGYADNPEQPGETFFQSIYKLPAASILRYSTGEPGLEKYWDIEPENQTKITEENAIQQFENLLKQSVERRLRSEVPIGASLSGGLDSSSIIALVSELKSLAYSPHAFTAVFPGFDKNEIEFANTVKEKFELQQSIIEISSNDLLNDWDKFHYHQEEPVGSASAYAQFKVFELARQQGIKVILDGQGADETLAGYSKYYKWYWQELFRKGKLYKSRELKAARNAGVSESFNLNNIIAAFFPDFATVVLERQYLLKALRQEDLDREFVRLQSKEAYYTTPDHFTLNGVLYFNTCIHGLEELLRYADRNSMAHGREMRLPFLSHELVEFIFSLPPHFKIHSAWTKWILRETVKNKLPQSIAWRKQKIGFEPPQKKWMESSQMQERVHEARKKLVEEKILHPGVLQKPVRALNSHDPDNYDWRYLSAAQLFK